MPAVPELGGARCLERGVEILLESVAEQQGYTDGYVTVAREVAVELDGEAEGGHHVLESAVEGGVVKDSVDEVARDKVGYHHLLDDAEHDEIDALGCHVTCRHGIGLDLRQHILGTHHGTRQQRREEGEKEQIIERIAARVGVAAIDVDYVADGPEREE